MYHQGKLFKNEQDLHRQRLHGMDKERTYWFPHWRVLSDYFLPWRYPWLMSQREIRTADRSNSKLLDSTSTLALRTLASGLMSGITSPARQWFNLRIPGFQEEALSVEAKKWLEEVRRRMMLVMSESNFYNSLAVMYLEWCCFGTAAMAIYPDYDDVFRCYNFPLGEFYLTQDQTGRVNGLGRRFTRTVEQTVQQFGLENVCEQVRYQYQQGGQSRFNDVKICHIMEENQEDGLLPTNARWREVYWEESNNEGKYLQVSPLWEWPASTPRWEVQGNDTYGTSPAGDALSDVKQLQVMLRRRAEGLDKMVSPPLIVDQQLRNRPKALGARGITYASTASTNFGAKPAYQVNVPLQEISYDIEQLKVSIREALYNQLFNMISQLDTVRSATEIDARREEKLIHLGPVLERFYNEGIDPMLKRIYGIMDRGGLLPEPPEELADLDIEVQYVNILSDAQKASSTISIERFINFAGSMAGVWPEARELPDPEHLLRDYAEAIGLSPGSLKTPDDFGEALAAAQQSQALEQTAAVGKDLSAGAKTLSETEIGGGLNALQAMVG